MINCSVVKDLLPLYVDGALSPETESIIKEHIANCPECKELLSGANHIHHSLQDSETKIKYHYSGVVKKIRKQRIAEFTAGAMLVAATCACIGKILYDEGKIK